jgi:hypothetical protein
MTTNMGFFLQSTLIAHVRVKQNSGRDIAVFDFLHAMEQEFRRCFKRNLSCFLTIHEVQSDTRN